MRIALVTKQFSESHGGVERFSVNLARELVKRGHEVHVFAHRWDVEPEGVELHRVRMFSLFSWVKMISFAGNAGRQTREGNFDIVYALTPVLGGDIFRIGGLHQQWLTAKHPNQLVRLFRSITSPVNLANLFLERKIFSAKGYGRFVTNSAMGKEQLIFHYGIPSDSIWVVYNGVDPQSFHPGVRDRFRAEMRRELGLSGEIPVLLFLAANWKRKGLDILLRALPTGGTYRLLAVGRKGWREYEGIAQSQAVRDRVIFAGPTNEPARCYGAADLFVLPTRYDPFANVCLEALACGLPVITTRENGVAELIEHGVNGYLLDRPDDVDQLRNLITAFLGRTDRDAMREAAAGTGLAHSAERTAEKTIRIFEDVVELKNKGQRMSPSSHLLSGPPVTDLLAAKLPEEWQEIRHSRFAWVVRGNLFDGRPVFYKQFLPRNGLERWKGVFRQSRARRAQRGAALMRARGISAPQTLLAGSLPGGCSYLLCETLPGEALEDYYRERFGATLPLGDAVRKRQLIAELGRTVAKIHRRGIIHGDLRGYNILVEEVGTGWRFHFLDNERTRLSWSQKERHRNLVQIATITLPGFTITDRMRFLSAYRAEGPELSPHWKETARKVHTAAARRLRKRGLAP